MNIAWDELSDRLVDMVKGYRVSNATIYLLLTAGTQAMLFL